MVTYNDDLALIVRYDGTKESFDVASVKNQYKGKVVFIYGSKTEATTNEQKANLVQAIWVSDANGGRYLDLANLEVIKSKLTHISGITIDGKTYYPSSGGGAIQLSGSGGISVSVNTSTGVVTFDGAAIKTDLVGTKANNSNTSTYPNTITGAKAYADKLASDIKGTKANGDTTAETIAGAKVYADNVATKVKTDLTSDDTDTTQAKTIGGAKKFATAEANKAKEHADEIKTELLGDEDTDNSILGIRADLAQTAEDAKITIVEKFGNYQISQGGTLIQTISFADKVVTKGEVVTNPTGQAAGTYIKFTIANSDAIFVNVADLIENYTAASGATEVQIAVNGREISATIVAINGSKITDGTIAKGKLATAVQNSLSLADSAYQKPSGGIPAGDLHATVNAALTKATSSIQEVTSGNSDLITATTDANKKVTISQVTTTMQQAAVADLASATVAGVATTQDIFDYLKKRFAVRVVTQS